MAWGKVVVVLVVVLLVVVVVVVVGAAFGIGGVVVVVVVVVVDVVATFGIVVVVVDSGVATWLTCRLVSVGCGMRSELGRFERGQVFFDRNEMFRLTVLIHTFNALVRVRTVAF